MTCRVSGAESGGQPAHLLQDSSCWAQGDTAKELTDCTRSVTFRISCRHGLRHSSSTVAGSTASKDSRRQRQSSPPLQFILPPSQSHQEGVWHSVRHRHAGQRDLEYPGAGRDAGAGPPGAALVQHIRLVGVGIRHNLRPKFAVQSARASHRDVAVSCIAAARCAHLVARKVLHFEVPRDCDLREKQSVGLMCMHVRIAEVNRWARTGERERCNDDFRQ